MKERMKDKKKKVRERDKAKRFETKDTEDMSEFCVERETNQATGTTEKGRLTS